MVFNEWLLRNRSVHVYSAGSGRSVRYDTQLVRDWREDMQRLVLGDAFTQSGNLGGAVSLGGVSFSKAYRLSPYFVRQPSVDFAGVVPLPSDVSVYIGDSRVFSEHVPPGSFELSDFRYYGGQRDVRIVIRDMLGREETVSYPFYFTDQGLAAGLHDYGYQVGYLREGLGAESFEYGPLAASVFHDYGLTDAWTVGLRAEGTSEYGNGGPRLVHRNDWLGIFSVDAAISHDGTTSREGHAYAASHGFRTAHFSYVSRIRQYSRDYRVLRPVGAVELPDRAFNLAVGYAPPRWGSFTAGYDDLSFPVSPPIRRIVAGYSRALWGRFNVMMQYRRNLGVTAVDEVFLGFLYLPSGGATTGASVSVDDRDRVVTRLNTGNTPPSGVGMGYYLNAENRKDALGSTTVLSPQMRYNATHATLTAEGQSQSGSAGDMTSYTLSLAGGAGWVGGRFGFSRPIHDSFGVAEIQPPLPDVRVYVNSQEVGRTDPDGMIFLPSLASFVENVVTINDKDVPIDFRIGALEQAASPGFRGGALVSFRVEPIRRMTGRIVSGRPGRQRPLEYHWIIVEAPGGTVEFYTGRDGDFYVEDLPAGRHRATVTIGDRACVFALDVPASEEGFSDLGEVRTTCDAPAP